MFFKKKFLKEISLVKESEKFIMSDFKCFYIFSDKSKEEFLREGYCRLYIKVGRKRVGYANLFISAPNELCIGDIIIENNRYQNKGYGSKLLKSIIVIGINNKFSKIVGNLSKVDMDQKEKLEYFYKKEKFSITYFENEVGSFIGSVELLIKNNQKEKLTMDNVQKVREHLLKNHPNIEIEKIINHENIEKVTIWGKLNGVFLRGGDFASFKDYFEHY